MIPDLRNYAIAAFAATTALFIYLHQGAVNDLATLKSTVALAQKQAEADAEALRVEQQRVLADTARGWSAAVDWHRAHPRIVRVLQPAGCVPQAGALPTPSGEPDARPAEHGSGPIELTAEQCEARINAAVLDAAQVKHLIQWIRLQHEASK